MQPDLLNPPNGSWGILNVQPTPNTALCYLESPDGSRGIVNVQPSNTVNTHRSNFPNNVKKKIDSNVNIPVSSNHFADFIRSANLSNCHLI